MSAPAKATYSRGCAVLVILAVAVGGVVVTHGIDAIGAVMEALGTVVMLGILILILVIWVAMILEDGYKNDN